tara:strand:+ start:326 stop:3916 length:3591 start_codon:yes stop_codon:yes gene_type:complete
MPKFSDRAFGVNTTSEVRKIFKDLQKGQFDYNADEFSPVVEHTNYLGGTTTFARMWSPLLISGSSREQIIYHTLNDNRGSDYEPNSSTENNYVVNELKSNQHLKPKAGITSINSKNQGPLGAIKSTTIEFVVHNKNDFETIYQPYFLKPGASIVVDYGRSDKNIQLYNIADTISNSDLELFNFKKFIYGGNKSGPNGEPIFRDGDGKYKYQSKDDGSKIEAGDSKTDGFVNQYRGLLEVIIGVVIDFNAKLNAIGSYECSITLNSENTSLLDARVTEENNLKFLFTNQFEEVLIQILGSASGKEFTNAKFLSYDKYNVDQKQEVLESFYKNLNLAGNQIGIIPKQSIVSGLFYQNATLAVAKDNSEDESYISYGLFEDLFLNTLITENRSEPNDLYGLAFNTKDAVIRVEPNLMERQKSLKFSSGEKLSLFLYPSDDPEILSESYNAKSEFGEMTSEVKLAHYTNMLNSTKEFQHYGNIKLMPFRDLFISVGLISKAFGEKQNVNDALISIYESINEDSYGIFKLKVKALNKSFSSIGIADVNLVRIPQRDETLTFDVTNESIVSNLDFQFTMPKGDLGNMVAIGQGGGSKFYDDVDKDNLSYVSLFGPDMESFGEKVKAINLPITKPQAKDNDDTKSQPVNFKKQKASRIIKLIGLKPKKTKNITKDWDATIKGIEQKIKSKNKTEPPTSDVNKPISSKGFSSRSGNSDLLQTKKLKARTDRDYWGLKAKIDVLYTSNENSVPPLLPPTLSLTVYGNSYLNNGDFININYLPNHLQDRLCFLITGIDQQLGSDWQTTYNTRLFLRPQFKKPITDVELLEPTYAPEVIKEELLLSSPTNDDVSLGIKEAVNVKINNDYMTSKKVTCIFDKGVMRDINDKKGGLDDLVSKSASGPVLMNKFSAPKSVAEYAFISAVQTTFLYLFNRGGGGNKIKGEGLVTQVNVFVNDKDVAEHAIKNPYVQSYSDVPAKIFITARIEDSGDDGVYDGNAAEDYVSTIKEFDDNKGNSRLDNELPQETREVLESLMAYTAKKPENLKFYDQYVRRLFDPNTKVKRLLNYKSITGSGDEGSFVSMGFYFGEKDLADYQPKHNSGVVISDFGFVMTQQESPDPVEYFSINVNFAWLPEDNNLIVFPKWFLDQAGVSINEAANLIYSEWSKSEYLKYSPTSTLALGEVVSEVAISQYKRLGNLYDWAFGD